MNSNETRVPAHLGQYIVEQDYSAYDEVSHAIWRFVLLHTYERLKATAHPAYANGLFETGMSVERIPKISEMNDCLARFGWRAVCVDGFIPPRAFVEFQALGILPIAADIRTLAHLAYTPAPDILHEAAGHAPILVEPEYRAFIQRFGQLGSKAFTLPEDTAVHRAIHTLSQVKEDPGSTAEQLSAATQALERANAQCQRLSEAAALARLYWWTAEYGLVGNTTDYRLYGAGLLSSLWESYSCHSPEVRKIPLSAACTNVGYDITRAQPQLFVAQDFAQLSAVLEQVASGLAFRRGGLCATARAVDSQELATLRLGGDTEISGIVDQYGQRDGAVTWLQFSERTALYHRGAPLSWRGLPLEITDYRLPLGPLASSSPTFTTQHGSTRLGGDVTLRYQNGAQISGRVVDTLLDSEGKLSALLFSGATINVPDRPPCYETELYPVIFGECVEGHSGAAHPSYYPASSGRRALVPRPRSRSDAERQLLNLYERALEAWRNQGRDITGIFSQIHGALQRSFPDEWLLRWNLFESLLRIGAHTQTQNDAHALVDTLRSELEALEIRYQHREPIATGLRSLLQHYTEPRLPSEAGAHHGGP